MPCSLIAGERTGIVGENGSGGERPDQGEIVVQAGGGVGHRRQGGKLPPDATSSRSSAGR
ncbi:hypothetical protein E1281_34860 [Actinomadura sp. KC345]|uniref:hypothetical protein n=1 Tax=Actinomadura sp. KC345 TaxID=2530371 RepID=UPI00104FEA2E|nr:hypothetical protein [Actinomadura sp. KC345]TDC43753.1 hypothetical protein E1281_34860 [Actinomadura sp. KC345]